MLLRLVLFLLALFAVLFIIRLLRGTASRK
jgi:hypothetical protein